jgi:hypothetical protein
MHNIYQFCMSEVSQAREISLSCLGYPLRIKERRMLCVFLVFSWFLSVYYFLKTG